MLERDIVSSGFRSIGDDASIQEAAEIMRSYQQHALAVSRNGECIGVLTSKEIIENAVARGIDPLTGRVVDIMSRKVICCYEDEDLVEAALSMQANKVWSLVVIDRREQPTGMLSFGDIVFGAVYLAALDKQVGTTDWPMN
jgi:predicted transcriptional regulator